MASKKSSKKSSSKKSSAKKSSSKKSSAKKSASKKRRPAAKRELIDTGVQKRYVRRDAKGQFNEVDDMGRSLSADRRRKAKTKAKRGQGDRGDR